MTGFHTAASTLGTVNQCTVHDILRYEIVVYNPPKNHSSIKKRELVARRSQNASELEPYYKHTRVIICHIHTPHKFWQSSFAHFLFLPKWANIRCMSSNQTKIAATVRANCNIVKIRSDQKAIRAYRGK